MDAKKVAVLLDAVESGSLMGVAEQNGYTPSGLSHLLHKLEKELGVQLAVRTNRGIALSEAGKQLLPYLRGYVESFVVLEREAALLRSEAETVLQIGAYASIAKNWMPSLLRAFAGEYPQIRVELAVLSRQELYRAMKEDRLHLIFACEDQRQGYGFLHLADDPFYAVLPENDAILQAVARKPSGKENRSKDEEAVKTEAFFIRDFEKYPFLMPSYGEDVEVHEALAKYQVHPQLLPASADDPVILGMVAGGMGVTMLSELVLRGSSEAVRKAVLVPPVTRPLGLVYKDVRELSAAERLFLQFMQRKDMHV